MRAKTGWILLWAAAVPAAAAPRTETLSRMRVQDVVRAVEAYYHSAHSLKATFLERYREGREEVRVESGTVYFSRPGRMRWEYESPQEKLFLVDGKTAWFYVPADRTVTRARMKESTDWRTPLALLTGKAKLSRFCQRIEFADSQKGPAQRPDHVVLRCIPRAKSSSAASRPPSTGTSLADEEESFQEVLLEVGAARGELARVLIRQVGGSDIEFRFGNWQKNLPVPEAKFHFQAPVGVAIVDDASIGASSR